jgi:hypothetical protein
MKNKNGEEGKERKGGGRKEEMGRKMGRVEGLGPSINLLVYHCY